MDRLRDALQQVFRLFTLRVGGFEIQTANNFVIAMWLMVFLLGES